MKKARAWYPAFMAMVLIIGSTISTHATTVSVMGAASILQRGEGWIMLKCDSSMPVECLRFRTDGGPVVIDPGGKTIGPISFGTNVTHEEIEDEDPEVTTHKFTDSNQ